MSPAKHGYVSVTDGQTEKDRRTDRQTDDGQSDPYVSGCFANICAYDSNTVNGNVEFITQPPLPPEIYHNGTVYVVR